MLLLLLLRHFSCVRLCVTPQMAAHQAPLSLGFSRQEHCSGLPFPSPMHESESESEVAQSYPTLSDPMDCSLPGSSVHGIFQAGVLEWDAIAFSDILIYIHTYICIYMHEVKVLVAQSCPTLQDPMDSSPPGSSVHGILLARILNYHSLLQGIFLTQGSNWCFLCLLHWQVSSLPLEPLGNPFLHCRQILYCLSHQGSPYICVYTHTHTY